MEAAQYAITKIILLSLLAVVYSCNGQDTATSDTADGLIYFSRDNGNTWENQSDGLPAAAKAGLGAIAVSDDELGLALKDHGIFLFDNKKNNWIGISTNKQIIDNNLGAFIFYEDQMIVGTQFGGVFSSADRGKTWTNINSGLGNLTIRRFMEIDSKLYVGTNGGFYSYHDEENKWELEYGNSTLQVNGITAFDGNIYIGTNQGAFTSVKGRNNWTQIFPNRVLHNISSDDKTIYAMTYNELFSSGDKGKTWQSIQNGLPDQLYTFNVVKNGDFVFAGQWDGVYRREKETWKLHSKGLDEKLAVTNMKVYNGIIVVSGSERILKAAQ